MKAKPNAPLIGITCCSKAGEPWGVYSRTHMVDYASRDYSHCVESSGGIPLLIPVLRRPETVKATIQRVDGLVLTGGPDIFPRFYGEEPTVGIGEMDYCLDLLEFEAAREAERRGIPILGICRGIQTIAVAFGGSLYQDIPAQVHSCLDHDQKAGREINTHQVTLTKPSKLFQIIGTETLWINSKHHQAVKAVPLSFIATAVASDGIIEAIERPDYPFLLGIQWHPEATWVNDRSSRKIFKAFIAAARR